MADLDNTRQELIDFMYKGLDHGINSIKDTGDNLIPFVLIQTQGKIELRRFITERIEQGQIEAEKFLTSLNPSPDLCLIAFDGFVTIKGEKHDAILIRSFDKYAEEGLIFAQLYMRKLDVIGIDTIGDATLLGNEENIIKQSNKKDMSRAKKKSWWKF